MLKIQLSGQSDHGNTRITPRILGIVHLWIFSFPLIIYPFWCEAAPKDPNQFYEKNFAARPGSITSTQSHLPTTDRTTPVGVSREITDQSSDAKNFDEEEKSESNLEISDNIPTGEPVVPLAFGVVLNGADKVHLKSGLNSLWQFIQIRNIPISPLYILGDFREVFDIMKELSEEHQDYRILAELTKRATLTPTIPEDIKVTKSPAWIITTERGKYVLDGVTSPERYFTKNGEFLEPQLQKDSAIEREPVKTE